MAALSTTIAAIGAAAAVGGTAAAFMGAQQSADAQRKIAEQQKLQMNLDAARQRRSIARQAIIQRSQALSNATNQGAGFGGSSGVAGGQSGITGQEGNAMLGSRQNTQIANTIFGLEGQASNGNTMSSIGVAISSFGSMAMNNASTLGKVGSYIAGGWGGSNQRMFGIGGSYNYA